MRTILSGVALGLFFVGCVNELEEQGQGAGALKERVWSSEGAEIQDLFPNNGGSGWLETEWLFKTGGYNVIGLRFDAHGVVQTEVRSSADGGRTYTGWEAFELTFQEGIVHNAKAFVIAENGWFQVRVKAPPESEMTFVAFEALIFNQNLDSSSSIALRSSSHRESALSNVNALSKSQWGGIGDGCTTPSNIERAMIFHTFTPTSDTVEEAVRVRQIQSYHMEVRGWCDVGYHYLVGPSGQLYEGRPSTYGSAYSIAGVSDFLAVGFIGSYCSTEPSSESVRSVAQLLGAGADLYGYDKNRESVKTYYDFGGTQCQGLQLAADKVVDGMNLPLAPPNQDEPSDSTDGTSDSDNDTSDAVDVEDEDSSLIPEEEEENETEECSISLSFQPEVVVSTYEEIIGDATGATTVEVFVDGWRIGTADISSSGEYKIGYTFWSAGYDRTITAVAKDAMGVDRCQITKTIDVIPECTISLTGPETTETGTPTTFSGAAASHITNVRLYADSWQIGSADPDENGHYTVTYAFNTAGEARQIEAYAKDMNGLTQCAASTTIDVTTASNAGGDDLNSPGSIPQLPYYYQYANSINPGGSCQNTAMAMVLRYFHPSQSSSINPDSISSYHGTSAAQTVSGFQDVFNQEAQYHGLTIRDSGTTQATIQEFREEVDSGMPVVVHGYFTGYGHVLTVLGYENGEYIVHDSAGSWNEIYGGGGYDSWEPTAGRFIRYDWQAFEGAIAPDSKVWMHRFYFVDE